MAYVECNAEEMYRIGLVPLLEELGFKKTRRRHFYVLETETLRKGVWIELANNHGTGEYADHTAVEVKPLTRIVDNRLTQVGRHYYGALGRMKEAHIYANILGKADHAMRREPVPPRPFWKRWLIGEARPPRLMDRYRFIDRASWCPYEDEVEEAGQVMRACWERYVLPWLRETDDLCFIADELSRPYSIGGHYQGIYVGTLYVLGGDAARAQAAFQGVLERAEMPREEVRAEIISNHNKPPPSDEIDRIADAFMEYRSDAAKWARMIAEELGVQL